ncbi:MAG: DUF4091 domain-containing protein [Pirellula sp.]|nr:DUF4091 domain-containing protein [Pirellula sp.]
MMNHPFRFLKALSLTLAIGFGSVNDVLLAQSWERIPIARDTWLSSVGDEAYGSNGAAPRMKLKSIQELSVIDFDPRAIEGREIIDAKLLLKVAGEEPIERITLSTITNDWVEGDATGYQILEGVSSFSHRRFPKEQWHGTDLTSVCIGQGGSFYASVDAKPGDEQGWVELAVPEKILRARAAGLSYGIVLMDDTGSTWTRDGERFDYKLFPNRFVFSKDSNRSSEPYLLIQFGSERFDPKDAASIQPPQALLGKDADRQAPRSRLLWRMREEDLKSLLGFRVLVDGMVVSPAEVPAWSQHRDGQFEMPIGPWFPTQDDRQPVKIEVHAFDRQGRMTAPARLEWQPTRSDVVTLPQLQVAASSEATTASPSWSECLTGCGSAWSAIDPLDSWVPSAQQIVPHSRENYLRQNHLWNAQERTITLHAARGAWVGFQWVSKNPIQQTACRFAWEPKLSQVPGVRIECSRYGLIPAGPHPLPDPVVPIAKGLTALECKLDAGDEPAIPSQSWLFESYVPKETEAGTYHGRLEIERASERMDIRVVLHVHDVVLPDRLSFLPEMNCYDLPENDLEYYKLGHRHRVVLNRLPYYQNGRLAVDRCPEWRDGKFDWERYDAHYEPLFTGQAFAELPRGSVPIECFYLPLHENWPSPMEGNYNGSYWADQAFPESYRQKFIDAVEQSADHFQTKGWMDTRFHVYLNNKVDFKKRGWSRGSSPWLLDEPANFQDYWALRYFALATAEGRSRLGNVQAGSKARLLFRGDISRPQWQRDTLDGLLDYAVISFSSFQEYRSLVLDRKFRDGQEVVVYGSNNPIGTNNGMSVAWCWDAWSQGADGVVPWQTVGRQESWERADELSLFYPVNTVPSSKPVPSIRLKAYCYGQQDVELLTQLSSKANVSRYALGEWIRPQLNLQSTAKTQEGFVEPAAWNDYSAWTPEQIHRYRMAVLSLFQDR